MWLRLFGTALLIVLVFIGAAPADEVFSGQWHVYAGDNRYILDLTQRGHEVFGSMSQEERNNRLPILVYGTVADRSISLYANTRDFTITLQLDGAMIGSGPGRGLCGWATINGRHNYRWHAVRYLNNNSDGAGF